MHRAEPGIGQRQASEQARPSHAGARGAIVAVIPYLRQRRGQRAYSLDAEQIRQGVGPDRDVGSISCVSASRPVAAVIARGRSSVSSGSTTASRGSIDALRKLAFTRCSGEASTALRVTSEPVLPWWG